MPPVVKQALRSRWFAACAHVGLWLLLILALVNLGGQAPELHDTDAVTTPLQDTVPVAGLVNLFSPEAEPGPLNVTNTLNPFFTRHFIPKAVPPPTTRKIEVTYLGFHQTGNDPKRTLFKLGAAYQVAPIGARIATNLLIAEATMQAMTLTNLAAQTNILPLNVKKELEVPIQ